MKATTISIIFVALLIVGVMYLSKLSSSDFNNDSGRNNVTVVDGRQIIEIKAKGGYYPKLTRVQAGLPTVVRMITQNTFDCSRAIVIPSIGYRSNLPVTGETDIEIPIQKSGSKLNATCSMGMYSFSINFE